MMMDTPPLMDPGKLHPSFARAWNRMAADRAGFPMQWAVARGIEIAFSEHLEVGREQVRFPRTKRKRIRKKWRKNPKNWRKVYNSYLIHQDERTVLVMPEELRPPVKNVFGYFETAPHIQTWKKGGEMGCETTEPVTQEASVQSWLDQLTYPRLPSSKEKS